MSGWSDAVGEKQKNVAWYSNQVTGNLFRPRTEKDFPSKVRPPKASVGIYGWVVEPFWHRKITGLCLDTLEICQQGLPEGWPTRVQCEAYCENMLELLEETDESDWKKFEDRMKFGPVESIILQIEELYTEAFLESRGRPWETVNNISDDPAANDARLGAYNILAYGIPEYDEVLTDDEKKWVKAADEEAVASLHEKSAEYVYQTTAHTEQELRSKILERRKRKLSEAAPVATTFGDLGAIL